MQNQSFPLIYARLPGIELCVQAEKCVSTLVTHHTHRFCGQNEATHGRGTRPIYQYINLPFSTSLAWRYEVHQFGQAHRRLPDFHLENVFRDFKTVFCNHISTTKYLRQIVLMSAKNVKVLEAP